jgi:predicted nucleic acid-binding protein
MALCTSAFAHEEAVRNIHNKAPEKLADLTVLMKQVEILPEPHPKWVTWAAALPLARKDAPVLAAALQGKVDIFVTGDRRDFGHLFGQVLEGAKVLTPADALEAVTLLG